ncbi:class I SAM-dependent methyltransferase [Candidatus Woesearchaeota archaeon]|nr:class I SAM-dependent methyltransferase [Candidatus Woesearchaeota archaeon]
MKEYISDKEGIIEYYRDKNIVGNYSINRFSDILGRVIHRVQIEYINKIIVDNNVDVLLDLASGPARISQDIMGFKQGVALDSSMPMLDIARQLLDKKRWIILEGDAFDLGFEDNLFDMIYSFRFIRHFKRERREELYKGLFRILKPNGILIFDAVNYNKAYSVRKMVGRYNIYDELFKKNDLINELDENGFKVQVLRGHINHFYSQWFFNKFFSKLSDKKAFNLVYKLEHIESENPLEWLVLCRKK